MFKGQRSNVVSTAPGEGAVGENLRSGNASLQGFEIMYGMARARERIRDSP